jgi:hypothetical protein
MHFGGPQRRLDSGGLLPQVLGTFGYALANVPSKRRVQPPRQNGRHFSAPPNAPWPLLPLFYDDVADVANIELNRHQIKT